MRRKSLIMSGLGVVVLIWLTLPFLTREWCLGSISEDELLRRAQAEFLTRDLTNGDLIHVGMTREDLANRIMRGEPLCKKQAPLPWDKSPVRVYCHIKGKDGRLSGVDYDMTRCGGITNKYRYDEST